MDVLVEFPMSPPPVQRPSGRGPTPRPVATQELAHEHQDHYYGRPSHPSPAPSPTDKYKFYSNEGGVEIRY